MAALSRGCKPRIHKKLFVVHSIKDKDKKTADPATHDYAVVNKSKKKKKEEDENAYATVDKSKKSKKVGSGHVL